MPKSIECTDHNGTWYPSMNRRAKAYGLNCATVITRLKCGWNLEKALTADYKKLAYVVEYKGKKYDSLEALAKAYGIKGSTARSRRRKGLTVAQIVETPVVNPVRKAKGADNA